MLSRWPTCLSWSETPWIWRTRNNRSSRESWRRMTRTLWDNSPTLCISSSVYVSVCVLTDVVCDCIVQDEEVEVDSHTMVKSASENAGTMRATGTMSDGAQTMIEHCNTMLESDLGTMVINSDDDDDDDDEVDLGSMRSEYLYHFLHIITFLLIWEMFNLVFFPLNRKSYISANSASILHGLLRQTRLK